MSFDKSIEICNACVKSCEECIINCLVSNASKMAECIQACRECSDISSMTARFMSRNSKHVNSLSILCALVSDMCAKECNKYDDIDCKKCSEACKKCSLECSKISKTTK
jgi:hypothetical protein